MTGRTRGPSVKYPRAPLPGSITAAKIKAAAASKAAKAPAGGQQEAAEASDEAADEQ